MKKKPTACRHSESSTIVGLLCFFAKWFSQCDIWTLHLVFNLWPTTKPTTDTLGTIPLTHVEGHEGINVPSPTRDILETNFLLVKPNSDLIYKSLSVHYPFYRAPGSLHISQMDLIYLLCYHYLFSQYGELLFFWF